MTLAFSLALAARSLFVLYCFPFSSFFLWVGVLGLTGWQSLSPGFAVPHCFINNKLWNTSTYELAWCLYSAPVERKG